MKTKSTAILAVAAILMASCAGNQQTAATADEAAEKTVCVKGQWNLENIVVNDTLSVRPAEVDPEASQYITFEDSTYFVQTNCNTIFGSYSVKGDSIFIGDGGMTRMACPDMSTEDALVAILSSIATVSVENDSTIRLNGSSDARYILLTKAQDAE
ncbi:MAG: META domain-containing protein [Muribaculaceae bacterium]|nr:META domain-containing protein [Muribaculaceae bacterium]